MGAFLLLRINEHLQNLKQITVTLEGRRDFRGGDHHACKLGHRIDTTGPQEAAEVSSSTAALFRGIPDPHEQLHAAGGRTLAFRATERVTGWAHHEVNELRRISPTAVDLLLGSDRPVSGKA
jgi:hypothetical protein